MIADQHPLSRRAETTAMGPNPADQRFMDLLREQSGQAFACDIERIEAYRAAVERGMTKHQAGLL